MGNTGAIRNAIDGDVNPDDSLYYGLGVFRFGGSSINVIDLTTALFVRNIALDREFHTLTFAAAAIPEPALLALFGIGLAGMGFTRRKKKSA